MINCCLNSSFKIYKIKEDVDDAEIQKLVNTHFNEEKRINITQFIKYVSHATLTSLQVVHQLRGVQEVLWDYQVRFPTEAPQR